YWYRLRMLLTADESKEMDNSAAEADAVIYASFALVLAAVWYFALALTRFFWPYLSGGTPVPPEISPEAVVGIALSGVLVVLAYPVYRLALPLHRAYG